MNSMQLAREIADLVIAAKHGPFVTDIKNRIEADRRKNKVCPTCGGVEHPYILEAVGCCNACEGRDREDDIDGHVVTAYCSICGANTNLGHCVVCDTPR